MMEGGKRVTQHANQALLQIVAKGKSVPQDASVVYLNELQNVATSFRGFSLEDLSALHESFHIVSFGPGIQIMTQGDEANFAAIILRGSANTFRCQGPKRGNHQHETTIDFLEKGDYIGQNAFFDTRPGQPVQFAENVKTTACVNLLMFITYDQLDHLNDLSPQCGNRMLRLIGQAASERIFAPTGAPPLPSAETLLEKPQVKAILLKCQEKDNQEGLVSGFSEKEIDMLLDQAGVVQYPRGAQVFHCGHQARTALVLLSGGLETRGTGQKAMMFKEPGEIVGEALFPFVIHKSDSYAIEESVFLALSQETIYQLNKKRPSLGFKLTRNLMQGTLKKMHKTYRPGGIYFNPERMDMSKMEEELAELRSLANDGLKGLLRGALMALSGSEDGVSSFELAYSGSDAVTRISEVQAMLKIKLKRQEEQLGDMVPKKDFEAMQTSNARLKEVELDLQKAVKMKQNRIDSLEFKTRQAEDVVVKLNIQIQDLIAKHKTDTAGLERELEAEREACEAEVQRVKEESVELRKSFKAAQQGPEDALWTKLVKDADRRIEDLTKEVEHYKNTTGELTWNNRGLEDEIKRLTKQMEVNTRHAEAMIRQSRKEDLTGSDSEEADEEEDEEQEGEGEGLLFDETVPRLERELSDRIRSNALRNWTAIISKMQNRNRRLSAMREAMQSLYNCRDQVDEGMRYKAQCEELQGHFSDLRSEIAALEAQVEAGHKTKQQLEAALHVRYGEVAKIPEVQMMQMKMNKMEAETKRAVEEYQVMKKAVGQTTFSNKISDDDVEKLSMFNSWLVPQLLEAEAKSTEGKGVSLLWRKHEVNLLKSCWNILMRRGHLKPPASQLDMGAISAVLLKRGNAEFVQGANNPIPSMSLSPHEFDGLSDLLSPNSVLRADSPSIRPKTQQCQKSSRPGSTHTVRAVGDSMSQIGVGEKSRSERPLTHSSEHSSIKLQAPRCASPVRKASVGGRFENLNQKSVPQGADMPRRGSAPNLRRASKLNQSSSNGNLAESVVESGSSPFLGKLKLEQSQSKLSTYSSPTTPKVVPSSGSKKANQLSVSLLGRDFSKARRGSFGSTDSPSSDSNPGSPGFAGSPHFVSTRSGSALGMDSRFQRRGSLDSARPVDAVFVDTHQN